MTRPIVATLCSLTNVMSLLWSHDRVTNFNVPYPAFQRLTFSKHVYVVTNQLIGPRVTMSSRVTNLNVTQPILQQLINVCVSTGDTMNKTIYTSEGRNGLQCIITLNKHDGNFSSTCNLNFLKI